MIEYIDTSVIVKWFKKDHEENREEALRLRERILNFESEFVMSYFGALELVRTLIKNKFPREDIDLAYHSIADLYSIGALKSAEIDLIANQAKDIEIALNLYAADSLHVATAIFYRCDILWSADKHHLKDKTRSYLRKYGILPKHISEFE